jgi:hypothetical protein
VVRNVSGSVTSDAVTVVVHGPPAITTDPNGSPLSGETFARAANLIGDAGDYDVVVTNPAGDATSETATVVVHPIDRPPPTHDRTIRADAAAMRRAARRRASRSLSQCWPSSAGGGASAGARRRSQPNVRSSRS